MATVLLSAAGSAIGGGIGGSILGLGAGTIGQAAGAIAGTFLDQAILGSGSAAVETGRARNLRIQTSTEGAPIPQVFGRMRLPGQIIWATRYKEIVRTTTQGGKATSGQRVREFSYTISFATGLCEGPIDRIGRVWADGQLLDLSRINHRIYYGTEDQLPDPKIEAVEGAGNVPAYRGLAYAVFEDLPVGQFGNRIPQLSFEIFRNAAVTVPGEEAGQPLTQLIRAVALSPGTGEFALDPKPARIVFPAGGGQYANINNASGIPDFAAALDQLSDELPACEQVSLVVSWFGDDLRCGQCSVAPRVEEPGRRSSPDAWQAAGLTVNTAQPVSRDADNRPNFGGTPSDGSIIRAIQDLTARGQRVVLYPFLLMDITEGNALPDPYGAAEQAIFPWRGRITLDTAPGLPGTTDQTPAAAMDVAAFFGTASATDFTVGPGTVSYTGPAEWTWRRFVLHMAALAAAAGGIESICIGTEMRGLTTIRSSRTDFPAVDALIDLAAEVRTLLPNAKITYAADWSEYFGYQPQDGSGDVLFHLDPLWADTNIDFVAIDDYTPLSDWRYSAGHLDAYAGTIYSLPYLESQVEGGEYYDYFYASEEDRQSQTRTPISDGAHGEDWVFRPKDLRGWWENPHHNRIGGVREPQPTAWQPQSKPITLTETGCPAVDLGANRPNVFFDGKSSESALPIGSRGARDDEMQRRFLQAKLGYWADPARNPVSSVYGGPMIPENGIFVWTWDTRPWPDFPIRESLWADGPSHRLGHWITGRVTSGSLAEVVSEICLISGIAQQDIDVSRLFGVVHGYAIDRTLSAREALQPLMQVFGFDAFESSGRIVFASRDTTQLGSLSEAEMVPDGDATAPIERVSARRSTETDLVRFSYIQAESDYRLGAAEARLPGGDLLRVSETSVQIALPGSRAQLVAERWLAETLIAQESASFTLPPSALRFEAGDVLYIEGAIGPEQYRIDRLTDLGPREVEAVRVDPSIYVPIPTTERLVEPEAVQPPGPLTALVLDLPLAEGSVTDHQPRLAVFADPWPGDVAVYKSSDGQGFDLAAEVRKPALLGEAAGTLPTGAPNRWQRVDWDVIFPSDGLNAASRLQVLNGANLMAAELPSGEWELMQFQDAELTGEDSYTIGMLLRGQRGTASLSQAPLPPGTRLVIVDDALVPLPIDLEELGIARTWRVGPAQSDISDATFVELATETLGAGLRPFAPAHVNGKIIDGDLVLSWVRNTRISGDNLQAVEVPLGEEGEAYLVSFRQGQTVLRSVQTSTPAHIYTAAQQATDGAAGLLSIAVAQLSTTYGYGPEKVIEIHV